MNVQHKTEIEYGDDWFSLSGPQLNSTERVKMTCRFRKDRKPTKFIFRSREIEATIGNIIGQDERGLTTIGDETITIHQVEHILSALYGMDCHDSNIELVYEDPSIKNMEVSPPIAYLDSKEFALAIRRSFAMPEKIEDRIELDRSYVIREEGEGRDNSFAVFAPLGSLRITAHINFPYFWGNQVVTYEITPEVYETEICGARSFFATPYPHNSEWPILRKRFPGLIRDREDHYKSIMIDYNNERWLTRLFYEDEPARHKLLDFIGDLSLLGVSLNASIYVYKPHHKFNRFCVRELHNGLFQDTV